MYSRSDLHGLMAMMPAFATPNGDDLRAEATVDTDNLRAGVDRMIADGADLIATTGSFGECHTLLPEELQTLVAATLDVVKKRVPLFLGCTSPSARETVRKMRLVQDAGGEGVLIGVPYYFPSTVDNAVRFFHDVAEMFPRLSIMIYHNPELHHVLIPVGAFERILESPTIVASKDNARAATPFMKLMAIAQGRLRVFVAEHQYYPYAQLGAAGCWSIDAWMGPWPDLALRNAVAAGDDALARQLTLQIAGERSEGPPNLQWRETANKIAIAYAGYCAPGPLRPPFVEIPPDVDRRAQARAAHWQELCAIYRPLVESARLPTQTQTQTQPARAAS